MDPFMQGGPINGHATNGATRPDEDLDILPRSVLQARQKFRLEKTGSDALVRRLPLARLVTMSGLSPSMYPIVMEIFGQITGGDDTLSTATSLDLLRKNDALIDGVVMLGFIKPRIVATQEEAAAANDPFVWCIDEVDPDDRQAYFDLVTASEAEAAKVLEPFPAERLQDSDADESSPAPEPAERPDAASPGDEPRPVELSVV